jgi:hypothetical protein
MFTHPHGLDFFVNVRATMLDEHIGTRPRRGLHFRKAAVGYDVCRAQFLPHSLTLRDTRL